MANKEHKIMDAAEAFKGLQEFAERTGAAKATFDLFREDGWTWTFVVKAPKKDKGEQE